KRLRLWTVTLALVTFVLTLLGTFLTRSGIINSVHSFTQSEIGPTFLAFLAIVLLASIVLMAARGHLLAAEGELGHVFSREVSMLVNNLLFTAFTFIVLFGTLYPVVTEAVLGARSTVGAPYFNTLALPVGVALLFLMGVGPVL